MLKKIGKWLLIGGLIAIGLTVAFLWAKGVFLPEGETPKDPTVASSQPEEKKDGSMFGINFKRTVYITPPVAQGETKKLIVNKTTWSDPVNVEYFNFVNKYPNPVLILVDEGMATEKLIERNYSGFYLIEKGAKPGEETRTKLSALPRLTTEKFKSISDPTMEVTVKLTPK